MGTPQPIIIRSQGGLVIPAAGSAAIPDGLWNTEKTGVLIDRLTFQAASAAAYQNRGAGLTVQLRYKGEQLTAGFVPIGSFCFPDNIFAEQGAWNGTRGAPGIFSVRLAKPLYLGPGEWIDLAVGSDVGTITLVVAATGLQSAQPAERWLPYFAAWTGAIQTGGSGAAIADQSQPMDLANPFPQPLLVERLVGRILTAPAGGIATVANDAVIDDTWSAYNVKIGDHLDRYWVPTFAPFASVFDPLVRSWVVNTELPQRGFIRVETSGTVSWPANGYPGPVYARPLVGMVAYRKV